MTTFMIKILKHRYELLKSGNLSQVQNSFDHYLEENDPVNDKVAIVNNGEFVKVARPDYKTKWWEVK
jgi:hypothetical protein